MGGRDDQYRNVNAAQTQQANTQIQGLGTRADQLGQQGMNEANFARSQLTGQGGLVNQAIGSAQGYDPNASFSNFMSQAPALQSLAFGNYSPLQSMLNTQAAEQAQQSIQNTASQFADQGALNSGAAAAAMGRAGAQPFAQVQNQLGAQQLGLAGQLMGQQQQINPQQQQFSQQALQNALGLGANVYGDIYGTGRGLQQAGLQGYGQAAGMATQLGAPENVYQRTGFERFMGGLGQAVNIGAGGAKAYQGFSGGGGA